MLVFPCPTSGMISRWWDWSNLCNLVPKWGRCVFQGKIHVLLLGRNAGFQVCQVFKIKETRCLFLVIDSNSISVIVLARNAKLVGTGLGRRFYHFPLVHYYLLWEWRRGSRSKRLLVELLAIHGFNHELPTKKIASSLSRSFDISF